MTEAQDISLGEPLQLRQTRLPNRIIRSATYEGMADALGLPQHSLTQIYGNLLDGGVGTIITGAMYVHPDGRLAWPHQCGADSASALAPWDRILQQIHRTHPSAVVVAQLSHGGALSLPPRGRPLAPSPRSTICGHAQEAGERELEQLVTSFADAARIAADAGFDAVQIHAGDGYLIHQFLSPATNRRGDAWGLPTTFLHRVLEAATEKLRGQTPLWVKLPWMDDDRGGIRMAQTIGTVSLLEELGVELLEISYGSMTRPASVARGSFSPREMLAHHPRLRELDALSRKLWPHTVQGREHRARSFTPAYNARAAAQLAERTDRMAVVPNGGIHSLGDARFCMHELGLAAVSLSRPLVRDPYVAAAWMAGREARHPCVRCNRCLLGTFSHSPLTCLAAGARS